MGKTVPASRSNPAALASGLRAGRDKNLASRTTAHAAERRPDIALHATLIAINYSPASILDYTLVAPILWLARTPLDEEAVLES
jgi:hypothetical protein